jgi:hypothetical protein
MNAPMDNTKREFLKKSAYVLPVILTLKASPSLAGGGSPQQSYRDKYDGHGRRDREHVQQNREYVQKDREYAQKVGEHGQQSREFSQKDRDYGRKRREHGQHRHSGLVRRFKAAFRKAF